MTVYSSCQHLNYLFKKKNHKVYDWWLQAEKQS